MNRKLVEDVKAMDRLLETEARVRAEDEAYEREMQKIQAEIYYEDEQARALDRLKRFFNDT